MLFIPDNLVVTAEYIFFFKSVVKETLNRYNRGHGFDSRSTSQ